MEWITMADSLFTDSATQAAKLALDGLSQRQQVISRNVSNVDTPGYRAQSFSFEDTLRGVFERKKGLAMTATNSSHLSSVSSTTGKSGGFSVSDRPGGSVRADGNNVDIDAELLEMSETGIVYQAVSESVSKKLALLKNLAK
jgi:flagellar basal-body rod protein FlgB